ncbi:MAG: hypothetical protein PHP85_02830 [Gallionella sp.]|nr:hypothetical protein [Gallionella sp.]
MQTIRRSLEKDIQQDPVADARVFFERLKSLESFVNTEPETCVRSATPAACFKPKQMMPDRLVLDTGMTASEKLNRCPWWTGNRRHYPMDDLALFDLPG